MARDSNQHRGQSHFGNAPPASFLLPLYQEVSSKWVEKQGLDVTLKQGNTGLYWQKFFHGYLPGFSELCKGVGNTPANARFISYFDDKVIGDKTGLANKCESIKNICTHLKGKAKRFKNSWYFITGMGNDHPVENNLTFHYTLGVPYLPSEAVKGMLRAWISNYIEDSPDKAFYLGRWFGSEKNAGNIIFFDALPLEPVKLVADVMTPHYGEWYENGGKGNKETVPADWYQPNPIQFLCVKDIVLQIAIAPIPSATLVEGELEKLYTFIEMALEGVGVGAKTKVGYGRFRLDD